MSVDLASPENIASVEAPVEALPRGLAYHARWVWAHWKPYRGEIPVLLALTLANAAVLAVYPLLLKRVVEGVELDLSRQYLLQNVGFLTVVGLVHFAIYLSMQLVRMRLNLRFEYGPRIRAFEHVMRCGASFRAAFRTGDVVTRLMDDVSEKLSWFMCSGIFRVLEALAIIVFGVGMMLWINPWLTLWAVGPLPVLVGLFVVSASKLHERYERVQKSISKLNDSLEGCFAGIRVVKAFSAEASQRAAVEQAVETQRTAEVRAVRWQTVIDSLYGNIWQLGIVAVLIAGGMMAIAGDVSLAEIIAFDSYVLLLVWPMFDVGQFLVRGKLSAVSIDRIDALEQSPPDVAESNHHAIVARRPDQPPVADHPAPDVAIWASSPEGVAVQFADVSYRYPGEDEDALTSITFSAAPGNLTALAGQVGAGKSTALALIPRLIEPTAGRVKIGERDARRIDPVVMRQAIGYVTQQPHLLSGTVMENIRFGREWIAQEDIQLAVELAGRPRILLLDDCTASLDAETEEAVWQGLSTALPACTTIVVTHRPATLRRADSIVLLDRGQVVESGVFAELNRDGTRFHHLYVRWKLWEDVQADNSP